MPNVIPFGRAFKSGTLAGLGVAAASALAGKYETGSYVAPINATSHVLWGDKAAWQDRPSLKYTLTGLAINHASAIFWATVYETFFGSGKRGARRSLLRPLLGGVAVSAGAYALDYYLLPDRLTPGFEKRLSGKSMVAVFGVLALGLAARELLTRSPRAPR